MLRMMTYQEANDILYTKLIPDERCIARKTADDNYADLTAFIANNPNLSFPDNRLVPVDSFANEPQPSSCFLPFDDMTMIMAGYPEDSRTWHDSGDAEYPGRQTDIVAAGWYYTIDRIVIGNTTYPNTNQDRIVEADWLKVELFDEPTTIDVRPKNESEGHNHFGFRGDYLSFSGVRYYAKQNTGDYRTAKIVIKAVKNTSIWDAAETAGAIEGYSMAEDVCSTFVVTVIQRASADGDNGEGATLVSVEDVADSISFKFNTPANTELDLAAWGTGSADSTGYWSSVTGAEGVDYGFENVVTFTGSNNNKVVTVSPHALDSLHSPISSDFVNLYIFASWAKCADSVNGIPPQPIIGNTCNVTVYNGLVENNNALGQFNVDVNAASVFNLKPSYSNTNLIKGRGSCVLHIRYRIGNGVDDKHDMTIKRIDVTEDFYNTYMKPVFYISNRAWAGNTPTNRNYTAEAITIGSTGTIDVYSTVNNKAAGYKISMCNSIGEPLTSDTSTYVAYVGSQTGTITKDNSVKFNSTANSHIFISFDNVVKGTGSETKYFKIEQIKDSVIPSISENMSPEFAIVGFTFPEDLL